MLILSKYKDYYDGVAGSTGIDKTIVYNRELIEVEEKKIIYPFKNADFWRKTKDNPFINLNNFHFNKESKKKYEHYSYFIIGFCGKIYIGWKLYWERKRSDFSDPELITLITYDFDFIKTILDPQSYYGNLEDNVNHIKNFNILKLFRDYKTPIFLYDSDFDRKLIGTYTRTRNIKFFINPNLKNYEFYKIFDTFQAFQEIQMFLGGVLGAGEKNIIEVEDKYKIAGHGFNKWSFRRESKK